MTHRSLSNMVFSLQMFTYFLLLFLLLSSNFNVLWSDRIHGITSIFLCLLRFALCPNIWPIFEKILWAVEKNVYCEIFCRHLLGLFDLWYDSVLEFLYWFFCLHDQSIADRGVLKSPTNTVLEFIYIFRSFRVCLMKLCALTLGAYKLIIVISFWCIPPAVSMECPSLSHLVNVNLKSTLSKYCYSCLFSRTIGLVNLLPAFHLKAVLVFVTEMGLM
jgi:hypothetical protein